MQLTEQATQRPLRNRQCGDRRNASSEPSRKLIAPSQGRKQLLGTHRAKDLGPDELLRVSEREVVCAVAQMTKATTAAPRVLCDPKRRAELG